MFSLSSLDPLIAEKSLLKHPFYQKWSKGELRLEDLKVYAKEYFWLVQRIPGIVSKIHDRTEDLALRMRIELNVHEELTHIDLWKFFASSLGISEQELTSYEPSQKMHEAVSRFEEIAEMGLDEGVAAVYALERELPKIAKTKKEGLLRFYGLSSRDAHAYFDEHLGEEKHLDVWRAMQVSEERAVRAAKMSLEAQNQVLDAVCERCGICVAC